MAGFTFHANRFDTDDLVYRLAKLAAMLAVAGLAASVAEATSTRAAQFAICQAVLRLVLVALYRRPYRHVVQARSVIAVYLVAEGLAALLWLAGAIAPTPLRYLCWALAVAGEAAAPILATLRSAVMAGQQLFDLTGAVHAAVAFDRSGTPVLAREDIGRHNAVDKVVGRLVLDGALPAADLGLWVSGRASFEIVQKAWAAGFGTVVAVSAPSALAVSAARLAGMTLCGFARAGRLNIYSGRDEAG